MLCFVGVRERLWWTNNNLSVFGSSSSICVFNNARQKSKSQQNLSPLAVRSEKKVGIYRNNICWIFFACLWTSLSCTMTQEQRRFPKDNKRFSREEKKWKQNAKSAFMAFLLSSSRLAVSTFADLVINSLSESVLVVCLCSRATTSSRTCHGCFLLRF